eukprot:PITA_29176
MVDEMASLHKNEAWDLVELQAGRKPIGSKWVFKKKTNAEGKVEKYKAQLVAKGYSQVLGIDFGCIFSPVAKIDLDIWIREDLQVGMCLTYLEGAIRIDCDSQSAILLEKNPTYHLKTKHIDVQCHFVRDMIEDKKVSLVNVDTLKNTADALTKSVSSEKFSWCRETMGVVGLDK